MARLTAITSRNTKRKANLPRASARRCVSGSVAYNGQIDQQIPIRPVPLRIPGVFDAAPARFGRAGRSRSPGAHDVAAALVVETTAANPPHAGKDDAQRRNASGSDLGPPRRPDSRARHVADFFRLLRSDQSSGSCPARIFAIAGTRYCCSTSCARRRSSFRSPGGLAVFLSGSDRPVAA